MVSNREQEYLCFNGAAAMMLRKTPIAGGRRNAGRGGFNGAAAMMLRKTRRPRPKNRPPDSFNGAAAMMLRKTLGAIQARRCPRCFNGAAAMMLRKTGRRIIKRSSTSPLQWGRSDDAAEDADCRSRKREQHGASMGPQR